MAARHWLQLALTDGVGPVLARRIVAEAGDAETACAAPGALLARVAGIGAARGAAIHDALARSGDEATRQAERAASLGLDLLCPEDEAYPALLRGIDDAPAILFARGRLEPRDLNAVAIVGSRRCSLYGREQAERFAALLSGAGFTVVSGGARGIDSAAHRGAMSHLLGRTIAVMGCGLDVVYPPENAPLYEQIAARGAVISEMRLGTPPLPEHFPRRNRIVSGISRGVLVIEADQRSGALITARLAGEDHGRAVFALPGRIDHAMSAGPHRLIRDGATLVTCLDDILEGLGPLPEGVARPAVADAPPHGVADAATEEARPHAAPAAPEAGMSPEQQSIIGAMERDPCDVDTIVARTSLPVERVLRELTFLSLRGVVRRDGGSYSRR